MTEEALLSVKYAVNSNVCLCACTFYSRVTVNMSERVCCGTDELLYSDGCEAHRRAALGGVSMSHVSRKHIHTKVFIWLPHGHARKQIFKDVKDTSTYRLHSVTPSQIKTNGFILFSRRLLFGLFLYEPEMYIVSEASVGRATGGACQSEAQSSSLDWWLAPGLEAPSGDRSNKFITKQQSVY